MSDEDEVEVDRLERVDDDSPRRIPVPAKVRFEVFKRDSFTCQYCGKRAPDIILECDHVDPVALGGSSDPLNLLTSCKDCNRGKGAVRLSDSTALDRQHAMLADLEERRTQIEMMLRWRDELQNITSDAVQMIVDRIMHRGDCRFTPNDSARCDIRRWLKRFTVSEVLRAADDSFDAYLRYDGDGPTVESWNKSFIRIPVFADANKQAEEKPYIRRLLYIQGIIRKRSRARRYNCVDYLEHLHLCGADLDDMERRAKGLRSMEDFEGPYDAWLERIGRPY